MARNGKIARLPLHIRNALNERLNGGESGVKLVKWLNEEVAFFLHNDFEGRRFRITEQNLSEWRQGGFQDWLRHEEARQFTQDLTEQAGELETAADGKGISDRFGALLAVDMARLAQKFLAEETDPEKRWERLKEISKELSRLRRDEHRAVWTWIKRQQWERQCEHEDHEEKQERIWKEDRRKRAAALFALTRAKELRVMQERKSGKGKEVSGSGSKFQGRESGRIQPNPTKNVVRRDEGGEEPDTKAPVNSSASGAGNVAASGTLLPEGHHSQKEASNQIKPNPTKSNQNEFLKMSSTSRHEANTWVTVWGQDMGDSNLV